VKGQGLKRKNCFQRDSWTKETIKKAVIGQRQEKMKKKIFLKKERNQNAEKSGTGSHGWNSILNRSVKGELPPGMNNSQEEGKKRIYGIPDRQR